MGIYQFIVAENYEAFYLVAKASSIWELNFFGELFDSEETFYPVYKVSSIWILVSLTANLDWPWFQLTVRVPSYMAISWIVLKFSLHQC